VIDQYNFVEVPLVMRRSAAATLPVMRTGRSTAKARRDRVASVGDTSSMVSGLSCVGSGQAGLLFAAMGPRNFSLCHNVRTA